MKNYIHSQLEMSRVLDFDPKIRNVQTLVPKNAISYHTSPPYLTLRMYLTNHFIQDVFLYLRLQTQELGIFDLKFGLFVKCYQYVQILMSIGLHLGQNVNSFMF